MAMPILSVDFDGVIHSYVSGWKGATVIPDPPFPGAIEALRAYTQHFSVNIFSSRSSMEGGIPAMIAYLEKWAKMIYGENDIKWLSYLHYPTVKPPARVQLDDRAITFTGEWPAAQTLLDFKPWYHLDKNKG